MSNTLKNERRADGSQSRVRRTAYLGLLTALAIIMGYVESLIPFDFGVPGIKLGLCNSIIMIVLIMYGWKAALLTTVIRVLAVGFMFGNLFSIAYSMAGALLSMLVMSLLLRTNQFDLIGISAAGGTAHNIGQIFVAWLVTPAFPLMWYMPVLMIAGTATGIVIGIIVTAVDRRLRLLHTSGRAENTI